MAASPTVHLDTATGAAVERFRYRPRTQDVCKLSIVSGAVCRKHALDVSLPMGRASGARSVTGLDVLFHGLSLPEGGVARRMAARSSLHLVDGLIRVRRIGDEALIGGIHVQVQLRKHYAARAWRSL